MSFVGPASKVPCSECGKLISNNGLAQYQHYQKHRRDDAKTKLAASNAISKKD